MSDVVLAFSPRHSIKARLRSSTVLFVGASLLALINAQPVWAEDLYWNNAGSPDDGTLETENGQWDLSSERWTKNADDAAPGPGNPATQENGNDTFENGDGAIFAATPSAVTIVENLSPASITFAVDGYIIRSAVTGGPNDERFAIDVTTSLAIDVVTSGHTGSISAPITSEVGETIVVNGEAGSAGLLRLTGDLSGSLGTLNVKAGEVNIQSGYGGLLDIDGGLVRANSGAIAGGAQVDGGTLSMKGATYGTAGVTVNGGTAELRADTATDVTVNSGSFATFGTNTLTGDIEQNGGTVDHAATATITGNTTIEDGTFTTAGQINGTVTLTPDGGGDAPQLDANAGTITGLVTNNGGAIEANGTTFSGGIQNNSGTVDINEDTSGNVTNAGGTVTVFATKTLTGNLDNNSGDATLAGTVMGNVTSGGTIGDDVVDLTGEITGTLGVNGGTFNAETGGIVGGAASLSGGELNLNGATFTTGTLSQSGGTLNVNEDTSLAVTKTNGAVVIDATKTLTGAFAENGGTTTNDGTLAGALSVGGGTFTNNSIVNGTLTMSSGIFNATNGSQVTGDVTVNGGTLNDNAATYNANGIALNNGTVNLNATTSVDVTNDGGNLVIAPGVTWTNNYAPTNGTTTNNGTLIGNVTMGGDSLTLDTFANNGTLTGALDITGGTFSNNTGGSVSGAVSLTGGGLVANGGTFASTITNSGGAVTIADDTTIATIFRNNSGTVTINSGQTLDGTYRQLGGDTNNNGTLDDAYFQSAGTYTQSGTGAINSTVAINGGTFDADAGTIAGATTITSGELRASGGTDFQGDIRAIAGIVTLDGNATGDITNTAAAVTINSGQTLDGAALHNGGTMNVAGNLTGDLTINATGATVSGNVQGETRLNSGALTSNGGDFDQQVTVVTGIFDVNGATFDGGLRMNGGTATISNAVIGDITNAGGTVVQNSSVDGEVIASAGSYTQNGLVTGNVTALSGTYLAGGQTNGEFRVSGAAVEADGANFAGGARLNTGSLNVTGNAEGDILAVGGTATIASTGTVDGMWTNNGAATTNAGNITGTVDLINGTFVNNTGGAIAGRFNLKGGTLDANGGSFDGGLRTSGGTLNINADTVADITNVGINVSLGSGLTLTGDIRNQTGNLVIRGTVDGDVAQVNNTATLFPSGEITGRLTVTGGTMEIGGGTVGNRIVGVAGTVNINGDTTADVTNKGTAVTTIASAATLTGDFRNVEGTSLNEGTVTGEVVVTGGTARNDGTIAGAVKVNGGRFVHRAGADINGATSVNGGRLDVKSGAFAQTITLKSGTVNSDTDNAFDLINSGGRLNVDSGTTLTGNVNNLANGDMFLLGDLDGDLFNTGYVFAEGVVLGVLTNNGTYEDASSGGSPKLVAKVPSTIAFTLNGPTTRLGSLLENTGSVEIDDQNATTGQLINSGTIAISQGRVFASDTSAEFQAGGTLTIDDGTLAGQTIDFARNNTITLNDATLEGTITSESVFNATGSNAVQSLSGGDTTLTFSGPGGLNVQGGSFDIAGDTVVGSDGVVSVADGASLTSGTLVSDAAVSVGDGATIGTTGGLTLNQAMTLGNGATVNGPVTANANITGGDGFTFGGLVTNTATIRGNGTLNFSGGLTGGGRVRIDDGDTDDRVNVGNRLGAQTFALDIDLSGAEGEADRIVIDDGTVLTGDVVLSFNVLGEGGRQDSDVVVIRGRLDNPDGFAITQSGLPTDGDIITYGLATANNGDIVVADGLNPGIGALAGNIVLTQSLIGSVINRPSSPFVSGLAFEDENPCGAGIWARGVGGYADSSGQVTQTGSDNRTFDGQITADYYGVQLGGDYACFNGFYNGWDLAFGGIAGVNFGNSEQPVFALDLDADGGLSDRLTSVTDVDFQQTYAGLYVAAVRDRLAVDLQYRVEETEFTANNEGVSGNPGLGLQDETFRSSANTLSGAVSYAYPVEGTDFTIVPTAGFAWTQVSTDTITFGNRGVVEIDDFDSQTGFIGATVSRTQVGADGVSALNQFATATIYRDFAEAPTSRFIPNDNSGTRSLETENLGTYGELSAGVNYVRILQPGELGAVKQFNASIRGDIRYSDQLESWGVTAQARFQF